MPVSDFECQIARGQIGRYLGGGMLSPEAMTGLEGHLAECAGCKSLVAERRAALLDSLGGEVPARAVVELPVENPLIAALRAKSQAEASSEPAKPEPRPAPRYAQTKPKPKGSLGKPLALAALLAVVLVGMSRLSHTATAPAARADASFAAETLPTSGPLPQNGSAKPQTEKSSEQFKNLHENRKPSIPTLPSPRGEESGLLRRATERRPSQQAGRLPTAQGPWQQAGTANLDATAAAPKTNRFEARAQVHPAATGSRPPDFHGSRPGGAQVHPAATATRRSNVGALRARARSGATSLRKSSTARRLHQARRPKSLHKRQKALLRRAPRTSVRVYGLDGRPLKP